MKEDWDSLSFQSRHDIQLTIFFVTIHSVQDVTVYHSKSLLITKNRHNFRHNFHFKNTNLPI